MASHGWKLIPLYRFDISTGRWCCRTFSGIAGVAAHAAGAMRSIAPRDTGQRRAAGLTTGVPAHDSHGPAVWEKVLADASDIYAAAAALAVLASVMDVSGGDRAAWSDCTPEVAASVRDAAARAAAPGAGPPTKGMWAAAGPIDKWWVDGTQAFARLRTEAQASGEAVDSSMAQRVMSSMKLDCVEFQNAAD